MQFDKQSGVSSLSPNFEKRGGPDGVRVPIYNQNPGALNAHPSHGPAGGELRRGPAGGEIGQNTIIDRAGSLRKSNYTDLSKTYYRE